MLESGFISGLTIAGRISETCFISVPVVQLILYSASFRRAAVRAAVRAPAPNAAPRAARGGEVERDGFRGEFL
jgi:hypothetical protein